MIRPAAQSPARRGPMSPVVPLPAGPAAAAGVAVSPAASAGAGEEKRTTYPARGASWETSRLAGSGAPGTAGTGEGAAAGGLAAQTGTRPDRQPNGPISKSGSSSSPIRAEERMK